MKPDLKKLQQHQGKKVFVSYSPDAKSDKQALYQILMSADQNGILIDIVPGRHIFLHYGEKYPRLTHIVSTGGELLYGEWQKP